MSKRREASTGPARGGPASDRYRKIFVDNPDAQLIASLPEGRVLEVNPAFERLLGWSAAGIAGARVPEFGLWADPAMRETFVARLTRERRIDRFDTVFLDRAGEPVDVILTASVFESEEGPCSLVIIRDDRPRLAERGHADRALRRAEMMLRLAGDLAKLGGWRVDLRENRVHWTDQVADIHGMPRGFSPTVEEGISFYAPECRARIAEVFAACARDGTPYDEELQILTASGRRVWV